MKEKMATRGKREAAIIIKNKYIATAGACYIITVFSPLTYR
jgi:hypothetical protein